MHEYIGLSSDDVSDIVSSLATSLDKMMPSIQARLGRLAPN